MPTKKTRPIDKTARETYSWWTKSYVFIKKIRIKTWQGVFIVAFIAGITTALIWSIQAGWQPASEAARITVCRSNHDCRQGFFCQFNLCNSKIGTCERVPTLCRGRRQNYVCGCDGKIYPNNCERKKAQVSLDYKNKCKSLKQLNLKEVVGETSILPSGMGYWRVDTIAINGRMFLAFNDNRKTFKLIELNKDLSFKGQIYDIISGSPSSDPADIRLASDGINLWYAFESINNKNSNNKKHFLNIAKYNISGVAPKLINSKLEITKGYSLEKVIPENPEVVDDPTPIFYNGKYVVLTRAWKGAKQHSIQHIRIFDKNFNLIDSFTLDLGPVIGNLTLSQNAFLNIGNKIYLIGGLGSGSPHDPSSNSDIYAIPLSNNLHSVDGEIIPLVVNFNEYYTKVTAAKYKDGKLYINYVRATGDGHQYQYLGVFDVKNNFKSIAQIQVQGENSVQANHASFDIFDNKIYFFYPGDNYAVYAKVFKWE